MKHFRFFGLLFIALLLSGLAGAQVLTPTHLSTALSQPKAAVGTEVELIINARIEPKWHLYATDFGDDVGPTVFTLKFQPSPAYELVGKPVSVKSHHVEDPVFKGEVAYWEGSGQIRQRIKVLQPGTLTIKADADYQSCTDVDGRCIPGTEALSFGPITVMGGAVAPVAPTTAPAPKTGATVPAAPTATAAATPSAVPTDTARPAVAAQMPVAAAVDTARAAASANAAAPNSPTTAIAATPAANNASLGLWQYLLLAFGLGLVAVLMPCVYPMLPMTISYFTSTGGTRQRSVLMAVVYGLSIIAIYTGAGVVLSVLFGADAANSISSHWLPNLLSFVLFIAFGLSFLGLFEINAPNALVSKADAQADKGGWAGLFFMAATLVLVSFSCTVPIVGSVAIAAANGELLRPTLGMLAFSSAFALPFVLFALFPAWLKSMPRSGGWLNVLKVVMGFVELGMAFKFLSSADLSYHWGLLPRPLFLTIWIVLATLLGFYLLGKIRLPHDSASDHVSVPRLMLACVSFIFAVYLVPGLFGAPLPTLSALVPPPTRHDFTIGAASAPISTDNKLCAPPRFSDNLELPLGLDGYFTLQEALRCAQQQGKPVFVDFTGHNCGNCRRMEADVWAHEEVLRQLRKDYVVVALYADDKTELPKSEWYTSPRDQRQKTTIGEQNLDYQISNFNANAQPYYVLLDPANPKQPLATPVAYEADVQKFSKYLADGKAQYDRRKAVALK